MDTTPDFNALRTERNRQMIKAHQHLTEELNMPLHSLHSTFNPNACYYACSNDDPCEHK